MVVSSVNGSSSVFPSLKRLELSVSFCSLKFSPQPNRKIRSKLKSNSPHSCLRNNHPKPTDTSTDSTRTNPPNTHLNSNALPKTKNKKQKKNPEYTSRKPKTKPHETLSESQKDSPFCTFTTASLKNPNTEVPDAAGCSFSNRCGGGCTGGGVETATFFGELGIGFSEGLGVAGGVMNTVYRPAFPIIGGGVDSLLIGIAKRNGNFTRKIKSLPRK